MKLREPLQISDHGCVTNKHNMVSCGMDGQKLRERENKNLLLQSRGEIEWP